MHSKNCILKIFIPTCNRYKKLQTLLELIYKTIEDLKGKVLLYIYDNNSSDATNFIVSKYTQATKYILYYKQKENIGFNGNLKSCFENANAEFTWIIGDDDFFDSKLLYKIIDILEKNKSVDLIIFKYALIENIIEIQEKDLTFYTTNIFDAIEQVADIGNILLTFMSSCLFRTTKLNKLLLNDISDNDWCSIQNVFPNAYLIISSFYISNNTIVVNEACIYIIPEKKDWDDKLDIIKLHILPNLYSYCRRLTKKKLYRNKRILFSANFHIFLCSHSIHKKYYALINSFKFLSLNN